MISIDVTYYHLSNVDEGNEISEIPEINKNTYRMRFPGLSGCQGHENSVVRQS